MSIQTRPEPQMMGISPILPKKHRALHQAGSSTPVLAETLNPWSLHNCTPAPNVLKQKKTIKQTNPPPETAPNLCKCSLRMAGDLLTHELRGHVEELSVTCQVGTPRAELAPTATAPQRREHQQHNTGLAHTAERKKYLQFGVGTHFHSHINRQVHFLSATIYDAPTELRTIQGSVRFFQ